MPQLRAAMHLQMKTIHWIMVLIILMAMTWWDCESDMIVVFASQDRSTSECISEMFRGLGYIYRKTIFRTIQYL